MSYGRGSCYYRGNFTYYMRTNSMGRLHSWEADSSSSDQEISNTLWVTKVYYFVHKIATLVSVLSQINTFHASPPYFLKIHFNIILLSTPAEWPLCFRFPHRNPVCTSPLPHTCYMPCPCHCSRSEQITFTTVTVRGTVIDTEANFINLTYWECVDGNFGRELTNL